MSRLNIAVLLDIKTPQKSLQRFLQANSTRVPNENIHCVLQNARSCRTLSTEGGCRHRDFSETSSSVATSITSQARTLCSRLPTKIFRSRLVSGSLCARTSQMLQLQRFRCLAKDFFFFRERSGTKRSGRALCNRQRHTSAWNFCARYSTSVRRSHVCRRRMRGEQRITLLVEQKGALFVHCPTIPGVTIKAKFSVTFSG